MAGGGGNEPNLTPFIDLFSVLICFLLMTAAWIQLETMPTTIEKAPPVSSNTNEPSPGDDKKDDKKIKLEVIISKQKTVLKENETVQELPTTAKGFNSAQVQSVFTRWKEKYPQKTDVVLSSDASATYGELIKMYDLLITSKWPDVGINPQ